MSYVLGGTQTVRRKKMTTDAKNAILANIVRAADNDDYIAETVKTLAEAYAMIVQAETQEIMTKWTTNGGTEEFEETIG
jgi:hypothetical protein